MKKFTLILCILAVTTILFAAKPSSVEYIFPLDGARFVPRSNNIIIRPGEIIDRSTFDKEKFSVIGSKSGEHSGTIVFSPDEKTVIFKPDQRFDPSETVTISLKEGCRTQDGTAVPAFSFQFKVTPLEQPVNPSTYQKELSSWLVPDQPAMPLGKTMADSLPTGFPHFSITKTGETAKGSLFLSATHFVTGNGYNLIINNDESIQYWNKITTGAPVDFKVLPNGMLCYGVISEFYQFGGGGDTEFFIMDSTYSVVDNYQMGNGYIADFHEFQMLPNGHVMMVCYDLQPVDMSKIVDGGHPGAMVAGSVIQELDVDKNVIFQWRSWDHYKLTDSYNDLTQPIFDAIHINSIELDNDSHLLVSTLALAEITKVNRQTGDIIWRMGGKNNQFDITDDTGEPFAPLYFMFQHDVRRLPNGNIIMFDGGDQHHGFNRPYSRAVEYEIDEKAMTAEKVWEFRHDPDIFTPTMGSAQRLSNGNTVIGWGMGAMYGKAAISEVDPDGNVVLELKFDKPLTASYRAFRFNWERGAPAANVMLFELLVGNTYTFDTADQKTGVSLKFNEMGGFGYNEARVKRYNYAPVSPQWLGKAPIIRPERIVVSQFNISNIKAKISFDADFYAFENPDSIVVYHREFEGRGLFIPLPTNYNPATNKVEATMTKFGEFALGYPDYESQTFPPLLVSPRDGVSVDQTQPVRLEWNPVGYADSYHLQVASDEAFTNLIVDEEFISPAVYNVESAENNSTYYWRVKAFNSVGESAWSPSQSFKTEAPYISIILPKSGTKWQRGIEHFITWDDIIKSDVIIELYKNDSFYMTIDTTYSSGGYSWDIPVSLSEGSNYQILIKSLADANVNDKSQSFSITSGVLVEEHESVISDYSLLQNHPNPFNAQTTITYHIPKAGHVTLKVYDVLGKHVKTLVNEVQQANEYRVNFDAHELTSGIYFYTLTVDRHFSKTRKMMVIN